MKGLQLPEGFLSKGRCEIAPMSTTTDLKVAMQYSMSGSSVLLCIKTASSARRGVGVKWLSAFPAEEEILYPPLTLLEAKGEYEHYEEEGLRWTIVTVQPTLVG